VCEPDGDGKEDHVGQGREWKEESEEEICWEGLEAMPHDQTSKFHTARLCLAEPHLDTLIGSTIYANAIKCLFKLEKRRRPFCNEPQNNEVLALWQTILFHGARYYRPLSVNGMHPAKITAF
jgi:hypothetical protein